MKKQINMWIDEDTAKRLEALRSSPDGFNLSRFVRVMIAEMLVS